MMGSRGRYAPTPLPATVVLVSARRGLERHHLDGHELGILVDRDFVQ
jgi:hypothetical protein